MMRKLIGPHLAGTWPNKLDIVAKWQPSLVTVLQPEVDKVQQLRNVCPNATIVGRFFHDDSHYASNIAARPQDFAREIHNEIASNPVTPLLDYVQSNNETNQDWQGIQKLNEYSQEWMHLADQSGLYKCAILAFSVGNPDLPDKPGDPAGFNGKMLYWQQVLPSLNYAQQRDHILLMHAYGYPNMFAPDADWYIYRYERQVQSNLRQLGITRLKYAYGEIGIDRLIVNGRGGYKVVTNDQDFVNQTLQWERDQQGQDLLLGGTIFTMGDSGGWDSYDIASTEVAAMIAQHYVDHAADYGTPDVPKDEDNSVFIPTVGTGEEPMPPSTFKREIEPDAANYGVKVQPFSPVGLKDGDLVCIAEAVGRLDVSESGGRHHFYFDTVNDQNVRLVDRRIKVWWPSGETIVKSEAKPGEPYSANNPFSPGKNAFNATVMDVNASDTVIGAGMGQQYPEGFNANDHTCITVKWVWRVYRVAVSTPTPGTPSVPTPVPTPPVIVPILAHPVQRVDLRRVTQVFGARPEVYKQYTIDGVPLKGHEGIDFGTGTGATIVAADAGWIAEAGDQKEKGYGKYVKVVHPWGETVYAHLDKHLVGVGDKVNKGQPVGLSGWTGNVEPKGPLGAHLHFGLRVNPYSRKDGWGGYRDPAPYLANTNVPPAPTPSGNVREIAYAAADEFGVDRDLFLNLVYAENRFKLDNNPSSAGAVGPAQIMPNTWAEWAPKIGAKDIRNPNDNLRVGARYLKWCLDRFPGDPNQTLKALFAYNWGYGNVTSGAEPPLKTIIYAHSIIHGAGFAKAVRNL